MLQFAFNAHSVPAPTTNPKRVRLLSKTCCEIGAKPVV